MPTARFTMMAASLAILTTCATTAMAGVAPAVDNYVCHKVKDLKMPGPFAPTPNPTNSFSYFSNTNCELGKLTQICTPSYLNGAPLTNLFVGLCCFKSKCETEDTPATMNITDLASGAATFTGQVLTNKKASLICIACNYP